MVKSYWPTLEDRVKAKLSQKVSPKSIKSELGKLNIDELDSHHPLSISYRNLINVEERPDRTEDEKKLRQELIDGITLLDDKAILILRHKLRSKSESGLVISLEEAEKRISKSQTGTVVKTNPFYVKRIADYLQGFGEEVINNATLKPGDIVRYNSYAPYSFFDEFPEIQILGYMDILAKLDNIPSNVVED